jgi:Tol biopolymer transport system component
VPGDTNGATDVFVRDRQYGTTERASVATGGAQADGGSVGASISTDGRYVAFWSDATNLVPDDTNGATDVFVRDRQLGTTERISVRSDGTQADGSSDAPSISAAGDRVAFESVARNLVSHDTNGAMDVFVRRR